MRLVPGVAGNSETFSILKPLTAETKGQQSKKKIELFMLLAVLRFNTGEDFESLGERAMQRLNKPAHAPLGMAFFLFLGLAIVPVSLRAAGVHVSFSPRLSAAVDAWKQISEVFGSSYQPSAASELASVTSSDDSVPSATDNGGCKHRLIACAGDAKELPLAMPKAPAKTAVRSLSSRESRTIITLHASPNSTRVEQEVARAEVNLKQAARILDQFASVKLEPAARQVFLKSIGKQMLERGSIESVRIPTSLRVLMQMKPSIAPPQALRSFECKLRVALGATPSSEARQETPNTATSHLDDCDL